MNKIKNPWLKKHIRDPYVQKAQQQGFRSRAAYKLLSIHEKDHLFKPKQTVLDLGAAPGAWSQLAVQKVGSLGTVIAVDRLDMPPIEGVHFIQGDLEHDKTISMMQAALSSRRPQLILSDIAPNLTGIASVDQPRSYVLVNLVLSLTKTLLAKEGSLLVKCFHGKGFESYFKELRIHFHQVLTRKPAASRANSSEVYLLARGYRSTHDHHL